MKSKMKSSVKSKMKSNKYFWKKIEREFLFFDKKRKKINIAYNIENLVKERKEGVAFFWEGKEGETKEISYKELFEKSNQFANLLKKIGIKKGDTCFIFLPRIPELYIAFLGMLKVGAVPSILFSAFGAKGIEERIKKGNCKLIVTNEELKGRISERISHLKSLMFLIVVRKEKKEREERRKRGEERKETRKEKKEKIKIISFDEIEKESKNFEIVKTNADDPAFMVFTSATAGTPVAGILIRHYALIQQAKTAEWVLDLKPGDVYWCTADPGWVTGVVYGIIAPLCLGIKFVSYEGRFDAEKWYEIIEKFKVSVVYTAPTALRMLMQSDAYKKYNLKSLRHICSVGEYLNPEIIEKIREELNITVHDTYWQSETGAMVIANMPNTKIKLGSMGKALPGISAFIINKRGKRLKPKEIGFIALQKDFPSLMKGIYKKKSMYKKYFIKNFYVTGDLGYVDGDGYFFFSGRRDDMIKTSGERVSVLELESYLFQHKAVAESAIVGKPDPIRGEIIVAFIVLKKSYEKNEIKNKMLREEMRKELREDIKNFMKTKLAGHAYPKEIYFVRELPKTRSGKIMRKVCKEILLNMRTDISSISNPETIEEIKKEIAEQRNKQSK